MITKLILPVFSAATLYTTFYFAYINGAHEVAQGAIASKVLAGRDDPLRTVYTGVEPVDRLLTALTTFFWPLAEGGYPPLTLLSLAFSGAFGSTWLLVTLESWRKGNAWTIAAFPVIFGFLAQTLTFAFAVPLYAALQLIFSATATTPNVESIRVPRTVLNALPFVFLVAYVIPSAALVLPLSETITPDLKQILIAIWQPCPAYMSLLITAAHFILTPFISNDTSSDGGRATLSSLRRVYALAFGAAALGHLSSHTLAYSTLIKPHFFNKALLQTLHPKNAFRLVRPWAEPDFRVSSLAEGVHVFLRWDYVIGTSGVLLWALTLYRNAHRAILGKAGGLGLVVKVVLLTVMAGPTAAAVELLWERDELVFHETGGLKPRRAETGKNTS